jgi:hypothetical protein
MKSMLFIAVFLAAANAQAGFLDDLFTFGNKVTNGKWIPGITLDEAGHPMVKENPRTPMVEKGLAPGSTTAAVWAVRNQWDANWEIKYQAWVSRSWNIDIFTNPNSPYQGLLPDCADAVYSMRAIFASENGLPFAVVDPSTMKTTISNATTKFKNFREGPERVTAFLWWFYDVMGTTTLPNDSIPIAINRDTIHPGGFMLAKESKHSYTIKKVRDTGVPTLYYSTQANDGTLLVRSWPSVGFLFSAGIHGPSGMRYYRLPEDLFKPEWEVPGYSDDQYKIDAARWISTVQHTLSQRGETSDEEIQRHLDDVCSLVKTRVLMVAKAAEWQQANGDQCMDAKSYDDLSTPSRDKQMKDAYNDLAVAYTRIVNEGVTLPKKLGQQAGNVFASTRSKENGATYCNFEYMDGKSMSLGEFRRRLFSDRISSNPNEPYQVRWGTAAPTEKAAACPIF